MDNIAQILIGILFDGVSFGMALFIISVELSVTMRSMGFIDLAHGPFTMTGGDYPVKLMNEVGLSLFLALLVAPLAGGRLSIPLLCMSAEADRQETRI